MAVRGCALAGPGCDRVGAPALCRGLFGQHRSTRRGVGGASGNHLDHWILHQTTVKNTHKDENFNISWPSFCQARFAVPDNKLQGV